MSSSGTLTGVSQSRETLAPAQLRLIEQLSAPQRRAVLEFLKRAVTEVGVDLVTVSVVTRSSGQDLEMIVLTRREDPTIEGRLLEIVVDVTVDTGVFLSVKSFGCEQFETYGRLKLPAIERIRAGGVPLYQRES